VNGCLLSFLSRACPSGGGGKKQTCELSLIKLDSFSRVKQKTFYEKKRIWLANFYFLQD